MNKVLFIILDGLGDRPIKEFGGKTPLEAATKPNLDTLASEGVTGIMYPVDIGIRPGSDIAHLSIFGYDISKHYFGRGPFEAVGYGLELKEGDVALRGNFATVDDNFNVIDRRAGRIENTEKLAKLLNGMQIDKIKIYVKLGVGHRAAVVLRGQGLDGKISDVDPHQVNIKIFKSKPLVNCKRGEYTASIVNKFVKKSYQILSKQPLNKKRVEQGLYPANILLVRGAGKVIILPSFKEKYNLKAAAIAGAGLYKGIGKLMGMDALPVSRTTGKPDTNVDNKIKGALSAFKNYDFIYLHIKGADVLAEDGNFLGKKEFIEKVDRSLLPLLKKKNLLIVITTDHTTSCYLKNHTADPVPILIKGDNIYSDEVKSFDERSCAAGFLGHIKGKDVMPIIIDYLGLSKLIGG